MHDDLNFENRMLAYALGTNDPDLTRHIESCPACREELGTVRELARFRDTTGGALPEVPDALVVSLTTLMPRIRPDLIPAKTPSVMERIRDRAATIIAELILDSGATPQLAGLRSATGNGSDRTRQLAFVSDVADLDLELAPLNDEWAITGQLGMDLVPDGLDIRFVPADQDPLMDDVGSTHRAGISDDGYFTISLTSGEWTAAVTMDDATIVFPGISI